MGTDFSEGEDYPLRTAEPIIKIAGSEGTNVRVTPSLATATVPAMALPPDGVTVMELLVRSRIDCRH